MFEGKEIKTFREEMNLKGDAMWARILKDLKELLVLMRDKSNAT
jgi:hypothetical protein